MTRSGIVVVWIGLAACDPAVRTESRAGMPPASDLRSREHESCSRSSDCAADLRCFEGVCRGGKGPVLAEIQAALGDRALATGKPRAAAESYALAIASYEKENVSPPIELVCNQSRAMVAELGDRVEQAAKLVHRCLLAAPAGSELRRRALADVVLLVELGLDPAVMARGELADSYALEAQAAPSIESLSFKVAVQSRSRAGSLRKFTRALENRPDVKTALAGCWKGHWDATKKNEMAVTIAYRYGFELDSLDDLDHTWIRAAESEPPADAALAAATRCVKGALDPIASSEGRKAGEEARWDAAVTFTVSAAQTRR